MQYAINKSYEFGLLSNNVNWINLDNFFSIIEFNLQNILVFLLINKHKKYNIQDIPKYIMANIICIKESVDRNNKQTGIEKDINAIKSIIKKSVQNKFEIPKYLEEFCISLRFSGNFWFLCT